MGNVKTIITNLIQKCVEENQDHIMLSLFDVTAFESINSDEEAEDMLKPIMRKTGLVEAWCVLNMVLYIDLFTENVQELYYEYMREQRSEREAQNHDYYQMKKF